MAAFKPIVLSLALVSAASIALAGHFSGPVSNRIPSCFSQPSVMYRFLAGNSYVTRVHHHYLKGDHGLWFGGYAQIVGAYSSNYLLSPGTRFDFPFLQTAASNFTVSIPAVNVMTGYDSDHLGFFVDYNYSRIASYLSSNKIGLAPGTFDVQEAYMTYKFNPVFAVKAGKFLSDFGRYDPTNPMLSIVDKNDMKLTSDGNVSAGTGLEAVVSSGGVHGSVAGFAGDGLTNVVSGHITNNAKPNMLVVNGGYNSHLNNGVLGFNLSYTNRDANFMLDTTSAFTGDVHYTNNRWKTTAHFFRANKPTSTGNHIWIFSGDAGYRLTNKLSAGGYGDYVAGINGSLDALAFPTHWILGAKAGYALTKYTLLNAYLQYQTVVQSVKDVGGKSNTSAILALTVKV